MVPLVLMWTAFGCGDSCQQLCRSIADRIETCIDDGSALAWVDVRAEARDDFVDLCQLREGLAKISASHSSDIGDFVHTDLTKRGFINARGIHLVLGVYVHCITHVF
ncbi:MAG: hypothetical protein AAF602_18420, partial [Myxococcota bacterium]